MAKSRGRLSGLLDYLINNWSTFATFILIYLFILQYFGSYMLTHTTVTGGDLGSHWVLAQYLRDYLVPHGKLIGWYPHWMGGLPIFQYYFVPPYFLMVLLSPFISLEIAFKLVSAAWIFFTPIAFYYGAKGLGFKKPGPEIAAALSLSLTWLETVTGGNYAQWGGNVKSAMAGQFPYGISLAFAVLCMGLLWQAYNSKKRVILNAFIFSMTLLHHLYTVIIVGLASSFFLIHGLKNKKLDGIFHLAKIFALGFMISGFWVIPSFAKLGWSSPPRDVFYGLPSMDWVFIQEYSIYFLIIVAGFSLGILQYLKKKKGLVNGLFLYLIDLAATLVLVHLINTSIFKHESASFYFAVTGLLLALQSAILNKENEILYLLYAFSIGFSMLYVSQFTNLLYARFIPMIFAIYLLLAAKALVNLTSWINAKSLVPIIVTLLLVLWLGFGVDEVLVGIKSSNTLSAYENTINLPAIADSLLPGNKYQWYLSHGIKDAPGWLKWNYEGLEVKSSWSGIKPLYNYTANLPLKGRLNYEYYDYGKLGTARIFEQSPAFTNRSVMESLLVESSLTFPFFYYMQKTVSETSWWPGFPIKIPNEINLKHGKDIFWVYNVQYYLVYSNTIKNLIKNETDFHYLTTIGSSGAGYFDIYSVNEDSHYADVPKREPVLVITDYWRPFSFKWFDVTDLDVPVVFKNDVDEYDLERFRIIVLNKSIDFEKKPNTVVYTFDQFLDAVNASQKVEHSCSISDNISEEMLVVDYNCVGKPLWVKIPYYPNWKTYDADRIYFVSPSLMFIYPNKEHVTLFYSWLLPDSLGVIITLLSLVLIAYALLLSSKIFRKVVHKKIINFLMNISFIRNLVDSIPEMEKQAFLFARKTFSAIDENKWRIMVVIALIWVGMSTLNYNGRASLCSKACTGRGMQGYTIPMFSDVIDNYDMGYSNEKENILRDLKCTAVCDPSRKEYVYVSGGGYVEYNMRVKPNAENLLSIRAIDNQNCRQNDVYFDGSYIGQIYGIGEIGQRTNFELPLPKTNKTLVTIRIYHNTSKTDCYGFDVFSNQVKMPSCSCLSEPSAEQSRNQLIRNMVGAIAFLSAFGITAYSLLALNRSLKKKMNEKFGKIKEGKDYKKQFKIIQALKLKIAKAISFIRKNKQIAVIAVIIIVIAYFVVQNASRYYEKQSICSIECKDKGFEKGYAPSESIIDDFKLGADNSAEYPSRNFTCTAVCDSSRKNYVYASGGAYVEFDMKIAPDLPNTLVIKSGNYNELCRQNDVYINGQHVAELIKLTNETGVESYEINVTQTGESKIRVKIDHNLAKTQCWGHDIFEIKTKVPRCICY